MKLLICDLDGTLVDGHTALSPLNNERLDKWRQAGHQVAICTGRNIFEMKMAIADCDIPFDYLILNNGAHILDGGMQTLYEKTIPHEIGLAIIETLYPYKNMWVYFCDGEVSLAALNQETYDYALQPCADDFLAQAHAAGDFQILCMNQADQEYETTALLKEEIAQRYGQWVSCHRNASYVDIVPLGCTKATGIKKLREIIACPFDTVYTIGDSYNDLPMIMAGDVGCTFTYAEDEIRQHADRIYDYVYELVDDILEGEKYELER